MSGKFKEFVRGVVYATPQTWALYVIARRFIAPSQTSVLREMSERDMHKAAEVSQAEVERGMEQLFLRLGPPPAPRTPTCQTVEYVSWRAGCEARTSITLRR